MKRKITKNVKAFLEQEIIGLMNSYSTFRSQVATDNQQLGISEIPNEENIWEAKIKRTKDLIKSVEVVVPKNQKESIALGSRVLINNQGTLKEIIVDGAEYDNGDIKIVSSVSFIGKGLLGKKKGDSILTKDNKKIFVEDVYYPF